MKTKIFITGSSGFIGFHVSKRYLDKGFKIANEFVLKIWQDFLNISNETIVDAKTKLQEFSLKKFKSLPVYKIVSNTGPRHKPLFKVGVKIKNTKFIY